jgi:lysyl-tRNA synthetase class 2
MGKWRAIVVFLEVLGAGVLVNFLAMAAAPQRVMDYPSLWERFSESILALIGVSGPITFHIAVLDNAVTTIGLLFGVGALAIGGYFLLRSAEPTPGLSQDEEHRIRVFLDKHGHRDSLGYFALRRDKSIVFSASGKSAVTYRVLAGVALSAGDPLGDPEAWPGAIEVFLEKCTQHAWTPAVLGCSEQAATIWSRHNLDALELGDEAIVDTEKFSLEGRPMRGVRQAVNRVRRAGYEVQVRRAKDIPDAEHKELAKLAEKWRGEATERGFSMAISRLADHTDPECVLVTATHEGKVAGMLQFVPWGIKGLSLDMMRRDRAADNGLNELMITETLTRSKEIGVTEVSLNFAFFRAALERGEKIGAGYVSRLMASILKIASRWWQIETLYKFNAKFQPEWVPRYMVFPALRDVPRIAIASMEAEGFGGRPPKLLRMLRR